MINFKNKIIYNTVEEAVDPSHTALVLWDVQNALVNRIHNKEQFVKDLKSIISAARKAEVPLVYTKITPLPVEYEHPARIFTSMKRFGIDDPSKIPPFMKPGSEDSQIFTEFAPEDNDVVLNKNTASIFVGTNFENMMRARKVETLLFTGISTEVGVASSARDSVNRGFYTFVVKECVSSPNKETHEAALKSLGSVLMIESLGEILEIWK